MMHSFLWILPLLFMSLQSSLLAQSGQPFGQAFGKAMHQSDISGLSSMLDEEVELVQPGEEGKYRKQVVSSKLADFLRKNPPAQFQLKHQGASADGQLYAIGQLTTQAGGQYKVLLRAKPAGAHYRIFKIDLLQP